MTTRGRFPPATKIPSGERMRNRLASGRWPEPQAGTEKLPGKRQEGRQTHDRRGGAGRRRWRDLQARDDRGSETIPPANGLEVLQLGSRDGSPIARWMAEFQATDSFGRGKKRIVEQKQCEGDADPGRPMPEGTAEGCELCRAVHPGSLKTIVGVWFSVNSLPPGCFRQLSGQGEQGPEPGVHRSPW